MRLKRSDSAWPRVRTSNVLPSPGTPSEQHVATGEQRDHDLPNDVVLADNGLV